MRKAEFNFKISAEEAELIAIDLVKVICYDNAFCFAREESGSGFLRRNTMVWTHLGTHSNTGRFTSTNSIVFAQWCLVAKPRIVQYDRWDIFCVINSMNHIAPRRLSGQRVYDDCVPLSQEPALGDPCWNWWPNLECSADGRGNTAAPR